MKMQCFAFYLLLVQQFYKEYLEEGLEFRQVIDEHLRVKGKMEPLKSFHLHLSEKFHSFMDGHLRNDMVKFLMSFIQLVDGI